jgi:hypothetical protein
VIAQASPSSTQFITGLFGRRLLWQVGRRIHSSLTTLKDIFDSELATLLNGAIPVLVEAQEAGFVESQTRFVITHAVAFYLLIKSPFSIATSTRSGATAG